MDELSKTASRLLEEKYTPEVHTVSAALETESGKIFEAVNIDHFLNFVCAETAALSSAINDGKYRFKRVVAMRKNDSTGEVEVVNMCGKCRQIFYDYAPGIQVMTEEGVRTIEELLPSTYDRQRQKIQTAIGGTK